MVKLRLAVCLTAALVGVACSDGGKVTNGPEDDAGSDVFGDTGGNRPGDDSSAQELKELSDPEDFNYIPNPGEFGAPCTSNDDCISGYCIEGLNGYICTQICVEQCPDGYNCVGINSGPDFVFICVPDLDRSCEPCASDMQCSGGRCVAFGNTGYCLMPCSENGCKQNYECKSIIINNDTIDLCSPVSGTCECVPDSIGLEKACKKLAGTSVCYGVQFCEESGWGTCTLPTEVCDGKDNDCNGYIDDPWLNPSTNKYESNQNCGVCGNSCSALTGPHASGKCKVASGIPGCVWSCDDGWFDVNENPNDGCECQFQSNSDDPDVDGDANCDGIEGVAADGVFVARNGSDSNPGTRDEPLLSVEAGIEMAEETSAPNVYVATGVYSEAVTISAGINIYGGYSADFRVRDPETYQTVIMGPGYSPATPAAVNAVDVKGIPTVFSGFHVYGADAIEPGGSSYAVYVLRCDSSLKLVNNTIVAGNGRTGASGYAGTDGWDGVPGGPGEGAYDINKTSCTESDWTSGGLPGVNFCGGVDVSGGSGGSGICPDYDESGSQPKSIPYDQSHKTSEQGEDGFGDYPGSGGDAGYDGLIWDGAGSECGTCNVPKKPDGSQFLPSLGQPGDNGLEGENGFGSDGCDEASGTVENNLWAGVYADDGADGGHGSGGGGGGAGGGVETLNCSTYNLVKYTDVGGSGGGGGSGGCAGSGGTGGEPGGGSFGLFVVLSASETTVPVVSSNSIHTGFGGDGGNGGPGGVGGDGGAGDNGGDSGEGKVSAWCADAGGPGGNGGRGGHGGGGGGACGGPSFGVFVWNVNPGQVTSWLTGNSFSLDGAPGFGGQGGKSLGVNGGDGQDGAAGKINIQ